MAESRISMEEEKLFRIGDVAKMFHISTGTLRHYERIGIVVPEFIEEKSSYRYYGIRQFEVLNTIRYLRVLDMPLEQIADFLANRDIQVIEEKLQNQKEMIREKKRQLEVIERKIDHRIHPLSGKRPAGFSDLPWKSGCWHIRRKSGKRSTGCL